VVFDLSRFIEAITDVTTVYRKGEVVIDEVTNGVKVTHVFGYPHEDEHADDETMVDLFFVTIGVKPEARGRAEEFMFYLREWHSPTLPEGPSYIHTGAEIGDQELALRLFAIGQVLGFWNLMLPRSLGIEGDEERELVGGGFLYALPSKEFADAVR
jgi:hypothetical protein